ncbi:MULTISPECIES: DUF899 family protein [Streptomyces]|uniref:DUF899 family protein n=1 Tax=Streptomyces evansiae TaxID=3075535 RepID=A0ABU2QYD0_9ACTN|nr:MULTISPECIES: DUF899 family protein [unclassified Streptomyces]MDT0409446.1 DUF899 family protein [Streptomyces sp. DSM 41979]MYQ58172.1 DUF899 domain-containing protein [Streptomyces sp. SID4926]SCD54797.1 Predicted dithiol-disulfide oxidoreductase, DUF899 family [Streptomyces sp. DfronAA-171]
MTTAPARPPLVDMETWQQARDALLAREKAYTHEGDALAAERRGLPMAEVDGKAEVVGAEGPVPFVDLFAGRNELLTYQHMWYDGAPPQGQCEGCTNAAWHLQVSTPYLEARGVSFAFLASGGWDELGPFADFMGYRQPWYSLRDSGVPLGGGMGNLSAFLRDGDRVFLTYTTTGRGNEAFSGSFALLDRTPYGRGEAWEETPEGWPEGREPCWYWRTDAEGTAGWGGTSRPVPQWTRPGAGPVTTLGRQGHCH